MAAGTPPRETSSCLISTDLSNLCPPFSRGIANRLVSGTRSGLPHFISTRTQVSMSNTSIKLVEGTSALVPLEQIEEEFAKDKWDARLIPGLRYAPHTTHYYVDFQRVPDVFRPLVKDYIKFKLTTGVAVDTLYKCASCLGNFFTFSLQHYPQARTLQVLSRQDIDAFVLVLKAEAQAHATQAANHRLSKHISFLHN